MYALEVDTLVAQGVNLAPGVDIEPAIVVAAHEYLVLVRKRVQPIYLGLDRGSSTVIRGIAGENKQVAVLDIGDDSIVSIRYADDPDWLTIPWRLDGCTSQPEE